MSDERKTLAALLRQRAVYEDVEAPDPDPRWKEALLTELDLEAAVPAARSEPAAADPASTPLTLRHVGLMAPFGAALFLLGYWLGKEGAAADLSAVHPAWWVGAAVAISAAALTHRRFSPFRR